MSDAYNINDDIIQDNPPPPAPWTQGDHAVRIEPLSNNYRVCAIHAKSRVTGRIATVIMAAQPTLDVTIPQCWRPNPDALERAVQKAIRECDRGK